MKKTLSDRSLSLAFVILLFFTGCNQDILQKRPPEAIKGVLDLTDWDLEKEGPVALNGEWEFYWERLLDPMDFSKPDPPFKTGLIRVPGNWNGYGADGNLEEKTSHPFISESSVF